MAVGIWELPADIIVGMANPEHPTHAQALAVLRQLTGAPAAEFHDGQLAAIRALVDEGRCHGF
ncbi:ATP-dependent DNA helicase RecQ [Leucobacter sp. 7(1)]|uniref:hypothetical protein n=1 Tax=Leucobacter sp. 7(1) TaxID=1255613 RepID=UPI00097F3820|nr:hypothetical protein [Leucobacter sp. 7(1)]SJN12262.1 ATP-dependent DNA helicase RecQ [Leucobacter sp. 7(1)]